VRLAGVNASQGSVLIDAATPPIYGLKEGLRYLGYNLPQELDRWDAGVGAWP
jgi:hypothetical protein